MVLSLSSTLPCWLFFFHSHAARYIIAVGWSVGWLGDWSVPFLGSRPKGPRHSYSINLYLTQIKSKPVELDTIGSIVGSAQSNFGAVSSDGAQVEVRARLASHRRNLINSHFRTWSHSRTRAIHWAYTISCKKDKCFECCCCFCCCCFRCCCFCCFQHCQCCCRWAWLDQPTTYSLRCKLFH